MARFSPSCRHSPWYLCIHGYVIVDTLYTYAQWASGMRCYWCNEVHLSISLFRVTKPKSQAQALKTYFLLVMPLARLIISAKHVNVFVVVCLFVSNFAQKNFPNGFAWNYQGSNGLVNKCLNFGGDPRHRLDTGIVSGREIRKMVSTDCAARRCSAGHALAGITIATPTSLRHRHWRALSRCF